MLGFVKRVSADWDISFVASFVRCLVASSEAYPELRCFVTADRLP